MISASSDFLCEDMKVKLVLKFRGREMAHTEFGFQLIERFLKETAPFGHPDLTPKLVGRAITVMLSPLPRAKRAKNPHEGASKNAPAYEETDDSNDEAPPVRHPPAPPSGDSAAAAA